MSVAHLTINPATVFPKVKIWLWAAGIYPLLMIASVVLKPSITMPPALFPPNALAFGAYYLLRRRWWPVILLTTSGWDFLVISQITGLISGVRPAAGYVLMVSWSSALICMGSALAVRILGVEARARKHDSTAIPLLVVALAIGSLPGDLLSTWVHAMTAHVPMRGVDVSIRLLSSLLTTVAVGPFSLGTLRGFEGPNQPMARMPEVFGIGLAFTSLFAVYYFVPWSLDQFLELMLLAGPMLWLALRCPQRVVASACAFGSCAVAAACARGFGHFPPVVLLGGWRDAIVSCQVFLLIGSGGTMLINRMVLRQRQLLEDATRKRVMLLAYGKALDEAEHSVRKAAAHDLHDGVAQIIAGQSMILEALHRNMSECNPMRALVDEALAASREAQSTVRATIDDLSLPEMEAASLTDVLASIAEFFARRYGFSVDWQLSGNDSVAPHYSRLISRSLKELLINAYKHSHVTRAQVTLDVTADAIRLSVSDAGVGFDHGMPPKDGRRRWGLVGLSDRIGMAGGRMAVESSRGAGCRVLVVLERFQGELQASAD